MEPNQLVYELDRAALNLRDHLRTSSQAESLASLEVFKRLAQPDKPSVWEILFSCFQVKETPLDVWNWHHLELAAQNSLFQTTDLLLRTTKRSIPQTSLDPIHNISQLRVIKLAYGYKGIARLSVEFKVGRALQEVPQFVNHYNLVMEFCGDFPFAYLWMERIRGTQLDKAKKLPPAHIFLGDLIDGIKGALIKGFIPCDLRAANLFITNQRGVRICDLEWYANANDARHLSEPLFWIWEHSRLWGDERASQELETIYLNFKNLPNSEKNTLLESLEQMQLTLSQNSPADLEQRSP